MHFVFHKECKFVYSSCPHSLGGDGVQRMQSQKQFRKQPREAKPLQIQIPSPNSRPGTLDEASSEDDVLLEHLAETMGDGVWSSGFWA